MPIPKQKIDGLTFIFPNHVCCICYVELEQNTMYIDSDGRKWDMCKECGNND